MSGSLLVNITPIAIGAGCAVGALSLLYGVFKKSSRMSWTVWQVLILFAFSFAVESVSGSELLVFAFTAGGFFLLTALMHSAECLIKKKIDGSTRGGVRLFDRLFGALTAVMGWVLFALSIGGLALCVVKYCTALELGIFQASLWTDFLSEHILDLSLIVILVGAYKGGYRLGLVKAVWALFGIAATGGLFVGALCAATRIGFLKNMAGAIAGSLPMGEGVSSLLGTLITALICFLVFFAVLAVLFALFNLLMKKLNRHAAFNAVDGALLAVILFVLAVLIISAGHYGIYMLAENGESMLGEAGSAVVGYFKQLGEMLSSSPLSRVFYELNPLRLLFG